MSAKNLKIVIHAFITSRLDYYNSLLPGIGKKFLSRFQLVQTLLLEIQSHHTDPDFLTLPTELISRIYLLFINL